MNLFAANVLILSKEGLKTSFKKYPRGWKRVDHTRVESTYVSAELILAEILPLLSKDYHGPYKVVVWPEGE